jgi:hypothetical protein
VRAARRVAAANAATQAARRRHALGLLRGSPATQEISARQSSIKLALMEKGGRKATKKNSRFVRRGLCAA